MRFTLSDLRQQMPRQPFAVATAVVLGLLCGCTSRTPQASPDNSAPVQATAEIGLVLEVKGDWLLKGLEQQGPIKLGDNLPAGAVVSRTANSPADSMILVSQCTGELLKIAESPFPLPKRVDSGPFNRVWLLVSKRYHSELISAQSRGSEESQKLRDAVVRFQDGELHLASVFEAMPPALYRLRLEPIQGLVGAEATKPIRLDSYEWSPSARPTLKVEALPPGAYELHASEIDSSNPETTGLSVLVVICPPPRYDQIAKDFHAAGELVASWGEASSPDVTRRFLQTTLAALADEELLSGPPK